jgi:hypothetical protein
MRARARESVGHRGAAGIRPPVGARELARVWCRLWRDHAPWLALGAPGPEGDSDLSRSPG